MAQRPSVFACSIVDIALGGGFVSPPFRPAVRLTISKSCSNEQSPRPLLDTTYQRQHHAICTSKTRIPAIFAHTGKYTQIKPDRADNDLETSHPSPTGLSKNHTTRPRKRQCIAKPPLPS